MENTLIPYQAIRKIPGNCVLVFAPHPDDEVFGCGGAIMRHIEQGIPVHVIVVSDGAYGASEETKAEYILQRQQESVAAARILGYGTPVFWHYQDRQVCYGEKLIQEILTAIRETGADLVYVPSVFEMHPDHRALSMAAVEAVRRIGASVNIALYEVGIPLPPNQLLDISDLAVRKAAAMTCFISQNTKQRYDQHIAALNRYRTYTLPANITSAEAYLLISAEELSNDPFKLYQSEHTRQKLLGLPVDNHDLPLVSVIIRSMDRPTLSDALDSVALQTYQNIEVIVVNAKGGKHSQLNGNNRFLINLINDNGNPLARSSAANVGLTATRGSFLLFLDDDDLIAAGHIALTVSVMQKRTNFIGVYTAVRCIDEQGKALPQCFGRPFSRNRLISGNFIPIHAVLFKSEALNHDCKFDETLDLFEDWDFWLQLTEIGDFYFIPEETAYYRISAMSGFGVNNRYGQLAKETIHLLVSKWQKRWDPNAIYALMESARSHYTIMDILNDHNVDEPSSDISLFLKKMMNDINAIHLDQKNSQQSLNEILNSRSWRITAPLRKLSQVLRKLCCREG